MSGTEIATLVGIFVTFIVSVINVRTSYVIARRQKYLDLITKERLRKLESLRKEIAGLIATLTIYDSTELDNAERVGVCEQISLIKLLLGENKTHDSFMRELSDLEEVIKYNKSASLKSLTNKIQLHGVEVLASMWKTALQEAEGEIDRTNLHRILSYLRRLFSSWTCNIHDSGI